MGSKHLGGDLNFAWPTAQIAVMGAQSAVDIIHRKKLAEAADSQTRQTSRSRLIDEYEQIMLSPYKAAERGYIDGVIEPATTRRCVADALRALRTKRQEVPWRKHGNIPL
jgi:propionyl-CoA carboxylase beta chain